MNILLHEAVKNLPALYSQEHVDDPMVPCRFSHPFLDWYWYPYEFDPQQGLFFGFVRGFEGELGYFSVAEFKDVEEQTGVSFVVDPTFTPMPLSEVKKLHAETPPAPPLVIIFFVEEEDGRQQGD